MKVEQNYASFEPDTPSTNSALKLQQAINSEKEFEDGIENKESHAKMYVNFGIDIQFNDQLVSEIQITSLAQLS